MGSDQKGGKYKERETRAASRCKNYAYGRMGEIPSETQREFRGGRTHEKGGEKIKHGKLRLLGVKMKSILGGGETGGGFPREQGRWYLEMPKEIHIGRKRLKIEGTVEKTAI